LPPLRLSEDEFKRLGHEVGGDSCRSCGRRYRDGDVTLVGIDGRSRATGGSACG